MCMKLQNPPRELQEQWRILIQVGLMRLMWEVDYKDIKIQKKAAANESTIE
jgi:hypothetical protein